MTNFKPTITVNHDKRAFVRLQNGLTFKTVKVADGIFLDVNHDLKPISVEFPMTDTFPEFEFSAMLSNNKIRVVKSLWETLKSE